MNELLLGLSRIGVDVPAVLLGLARVAPVALIVPALGLRWWPVPLRIGFAFVLAVSVVPIVAPATSSSLTSSTSPAFVSELVSQALSGVPVALGAAALLWAVSMAAGVYQQALDEVSLVQPRGHGEEAQAGQANVESGGVAALMSLAVWIAFLEMGGPSRVAVALARAPAQAIAPSQVVTTAVAQLVGSIELAVGFALPALVVWVLANATVAVARGVAIRPRADVLAPLGPLLALVLLALLFERVLEDVVAHVDDSLPPP